MRIFFAKCFSFKDDNASTNEVHVTNDYLEIYTVPAKMDMDALSTALNLINGRGGNVKLRYLHISLIGQNCT